MKLVARPQNCRKLNCHTTTTAVSEHGYQSLHRSTSKGSVDGRTTTIHSHGTFTNTPFNGNHTVHLPLPADPTHSSLLHYNPSNPRHPQQTCQNPQRRSTLPLPHPPRLQKILDWSFRWEIHPLRQQRSRTRLHHHPAYMASQRPTEELLVR